MKIRIVAAALSAVLLGIAFNLCGAAGLVALLPLLLASRSSGSLSRRADFLTFLAAAFSFYFIDLYWVTNSIAGFTSLPPLLTSLVMALLAFYLALYPALFAIGWRQLAPAAGKPWQIFFSIIGGAALWLLLEKLRGLVLGGFPWHPLGLTLVDYPLPKRLLPWGGVDLISALIVAANLCFFSAWSSWQKQRKASAILLFLLPFILLLPLPGSGPRPVTGQETTLRLALIQPNVAQQEKWQPKNRQAIIDKMLSLTNEALAQSEKPDLIIWPESALPLFLEREPALLAQLKQLVREKDFALLLGGARLLFEEDGETRLYNSAYLFSPQVSPLVNPQLSPDGWQVYDKIKLVPYGEYTPLVTLFPFISKIVPGRDYNRGRRQKLLTLTVDQDGREKIIRLAPSICFESVFPAYTADFFPLGADLIVNLTNDAWFGDSPGPRQHLSNLRPRTLENHCWLLRCANTGISAIINPRGVIEKKLDLNREGILPATITLAPAGSFFSRHPRLQLGLAALVLLAAIIRRRGENKAELDRPAPLV